MAMKKKPTGSDRGLQAKAKNAETKAQTAKAQARLKKPSNDVSGTLSKGNVRMNMPGQRDLVKGPGAWTGRVEKRATDQAKRKNK
jgi:hypothetical protein